MIPAEYTEFFELLEKSACKTLKEQNTALYLRTNHRIYCVTVDNGIIENVRQGIRKCDYLLWDEKNKAIILIELKGVDINSALDQLKQTVTYITENQELDFMGHDIKYIFACCVSNRNVVPKMIKDHERVLCKILRSKYKGTTRINNIDDLLVFVRSNRNKQNSINDDKRTISISGSSPLPIYPRIWDQYIDKTDKNDSGAARTRQFS